MVAWVAFQDERVTDGCKRGLHLKLRISPAKCWRWVKVSRSSRLSKQPSFQQHQPTLPGLILVRNMSWTTKSCSKLTHNSLQVLYFNAFAGGLVFRNCHHDAIATVYAVAISIDKHGGVSRHRLCQPRNTRLSIKSSPLTTATMPSHARGPCRNMSWDLGSVRWINWPQ